MHKFLGLFSLLSLSVLLILTSALTSCSSAIGSSKQVFRNREDDYIRQPVTQAPALVTPAGLNPIQTQPVFTVPAGPSSYPAQAKPVNLQPPTLAN